jgi:cobalt-zinc-cadmium efflux system outer membrane protein
MNRKHMSWGRLSIAAHLLASLLALPAQAEVSLTAAVDAAWQRAVVARTAIGEQRTAAAVAESANRWWAEPPAISISHRDDRLNDNLGKRESGVDLSLPLWLPGQRNAYGQVATAGLAKAEAAQRAARWRIAGDVRESAWRVVALQAEVAKMATTADSLKRHAEDVSRRVKAGDLPRTDLLAAQAEQLAARNRLGNAELQLREARQQWHTLTGLANLPQVAELTETLPADMKVSADHPALQEAASEVESALRQFNLARKSHREAPELNVGWRHDVGGRGTSDENSIVVGVRLPFGTDARNKTMLARAEAALDIARVTEQRQREQLDTQAATAREALTLAELHAETTKEQARLLRQRSDLLERAFVAGELALPECLRALAAAGEADAIAARQQALLGLARARLLQSLGLQP